MSGKAFDARLAQAQRTLDRSDGLLSQAITKAAFRNSLLAVLAETWPSSVESYATYRRESAPYSLARQEGRT
jgi:hypothetical protein